VSAIRLIATIFGAVYLLVGLAGFIPALVTGSAPADMPSADGNLLGIFPINQLHNLVHIVIGAALLYGATQTPRAIAVSRVIGIVYLVVALAGVVVPDFFGLMPIGGADILLHLVTAAILLYIGFVADDNPSMTRDRATASR
jgi:Domain of unknown function (DUF4383)